MNIRMVRLRSTDPGTVVIHEAAYGIHREFSGMGAIQQIPFDTIEQLLWQPGFKYMIDSGMLYIDDMQDKIDLGLEEPDTKVPTKIKVLNEAQMLTLLKVKPFKEFKEELDTVSIEQINNLVDFAVKNELVDSEKDAYLKDITGKDVFQLISIKKRNEEADKRAEAKTKERKAEGVFEQL